MPWVPELFTAPTLQRIQDKWREDKLAAVPYFDGLMTGESDALLESFAGGAELYDPIRGRVKGVGAFHAYVADMSSCSRSATSRSRTSSASSASGAASRR
jgi:hypothetical protein